MWGSCQRSGAGGGDRDHRRFPGAGGGRASEQRPGFARKDGDRAVEARADGTPRGHYLQRTPGHRTERQDRAAHAVRGTIGACVLPCPARTRRSCGKSAAKRSPRRPPRKSPLPRPQPTHPPRDQASQPRFSFQRPRVKSGNLTGALPSSTEASLSGPGALQAAASYTSRSGAMPLCIHSISR